MLLSLHQLSKCTQYLISIEFFIGFQRQTTPNGVNGNGNAIRDPISPTHNDSSDYKYGEILTSKLCWTYFYCHVLQEGLMQVLYISPMLLSRQKYKSHTTKLEKNRSMNTW